MSGFSNFFTNILYKLGLRAPAPALSGTEQGGGAEPEADSKPKVRIIRTEPYLGKEGEHLVLVLDHSFENVPSWVEWDPERKIAAIAQMNGDLDEVRLVIGAQYIEQLRSEKKLLLVSNDTASNDNRAKIIHYVPFLPRL